MLGCLETASLRVVRNGRVVWASGPGGSDWISASWNRIVDDISLGTFSLALANEDCCPPPIHAVADNVEFVRNDVVEWSGQIVRFGEDGEGITVEAADLLGRYKKRIVRSDISLVGAELTTQVDAIRTDADSVDPVPIIWTPLPTSIATDLTINASDVRIAADALLEIAGNGLDITAVGRRVYYGDLSTLPLRDLRITPQMIRGVPTLGEAGEGVATRVIATDGSGNVAVYPPGAPVVDARYGLEEVVIELTDANPTVLAQTAQAEWAERNRVPRFLAFADGAWLDEDFPYTLGELIPGRVLRVDVRGECAAIEQTMRISQITYRLTAGDEQVRIEAAPIGTIFEGESV
jgi:hypothetical protein